MDTKTKTVTCWDFDPLSPELQQVLTNLKMRRARDPISKEDREIRQEARYTFDDILYLLQLQKELSDKSNGFS
tara:strand:- start:249 stop:467 length:219 start_codon:yes stop_codon:yes gene_type:complete